MKVTLKNVFLIIYVLVLLLITFSANAQTTLTQTIKGTVIDKDSEMPLIGANIIITSTAEMMGTSTDIDGNFRIENVPIGRHSIQVSYLGYEESNLQSVLLTSGKELSINVELQEALNQMNEVVVIAKHDKTKPINELATVSARSFSVEETARYASSLFDPARMAQNYAGVTVGGGSSDLFNEIIVRGNSPKGVMWRLEGIEIPNPNHFGGMGNSGGGISMLSSTTLSNSDFYTGAFPSEFGNATSGVFDLNMRKGNNEKREYSFMIGALGVEAGLEGPFGKNYKGSYLLNYRYSTLGLLNAIGLNPAGDVLPEYQDLSFKINLPTKGYGTFAIFGLAGKNTASQTAEPDSTKWEDEDGKWSFEEHQKVGTIGVSHKLILTPTSYLRTVVAASSDSYEAEESYFDVDKNYEEILDEVAIFDNKILRATTTYTNKINSKNTFQVGGIFTNQKFSFKSEEYIDAEDVWESYLNNEGQTQLYQAYAHWKHRFDEKWTLNSGVHYTYFGLNGSQSLEPRAGIKFQASPKQSWSAAVGLHSKPEHVAFYFAEVTEEGQPKTAPNKDLDMTKSLQAVIGYDQRLGKNLRLKIETYYQHLYDVPIVNEPGSTSSVINTQDIWDILGETFEASNDGTARNYGVDITIEKFFSKNYYFLISGSVFDSKYTPKDGNEYHTRYASNYQSNVLFGKEWKVGKSKKNIFGINGKSIFAGGNRITPIDLPASRAAGETVRDNTQRFGAHAPAYWRFDVGISYKINKKRMTHSILLDIQNVTNHENVDYQYYSSNSDRIINVTQTGLFPTFNYRIEF